MIQKRRISSFPSDEKFVNQPGFFALAFDPPIKNRSPLASFLFPLVFLMWDMVVLPPRSAGAAVPTTEEEEEKEGGRRRFPPSPC